MFSPLLSLLLFIYPSSPPLHFAPSSSPTCMLLSRSINVLRVKGRHLGREGVVVQGSAEAYNLPFRPNLSYPQPSFLSCILSHFHSSFCLRRGMNFNHSALHLQSQYRPIFFLLSFLNLDTFSVSSSISASSSFLLQQIYPHLRYKLGSTSSINKYLPLRPSVFKRCCGKW